MPGISPCGLKAKSERVRLAAPSRNQGPKPRHTSPSWLQRLEILRRRGNSAPMKHPESESGSCRTADSTGSCRPADSTKPLDVAAQNSQGELSVSGRDGLVRSTSADGQVVVRSSRCRTTRKELTLQV